MEYTGEYTTRLLKGTGTKVNILKYKSKDNFPYCNCDKCGKPIIKTMYVVQDAETDLEMMYLGSDCVKSI